MPVPGMGDLRYGVRSLRFKLALTSVLVVEVIMLVLLIGNSARIAADALEEQIRYRVRELAPLFNASLARPLVERDYATLDETLTQVVGKDGILYLAVTDLEQRMVAEVGDKPQRYDRPSNGSDLRHIDSYLHHDLPITLAGRPVGLLQMSFDTGFLTRVISRLRRQGLLIASAGVIVTFVLLTLVGILLTRNLAALAAAARAMSAGDLSVRVDHVTHDEVGATARAFNTMAERLEAFYRSLKQSEQRYQTLAEVSPVGIFNTDAEGNYIYVNERYTEITGFPRERFYGRGWGETLCPEDRQRIQRAWSASVKKGKPFSEEYRILTSSGGRLWMYVQAIRVETESGYGGYVGTVTDITKLKDIEWELARHRDKLEELVEERTRELDSAQTLLLQKERLATLGQVTATVSHELRNPLGVISNATYYLKRILSKGKPEAGGQAQQKNSEKFVQYLDIIEREVGAANRIIADLLATTRTKQPVRQSVSLDELINTVMLGEGLPVGVCWEYIREPRPFMLTVDSQQLRQVLHNLITNAVQALDGKGRIRLVARVCDKGWELCLSDSGPGITAASHERVFEPLYTTKAKGNGLGLWISREIVQRHGGQLQLADSVLGGATFCLWLPIESTGDKHENESVIISRFR